MLLGNSNIQESVFIWSLQLINTGQNILFKLIQSRLKNIQKINKKIKRK